LAKNYGDWDILKSLGEGGQAHIFLVQNSKDQRKAVLKRLKNIHRLERFKTEFKVMEESDGQFFPKVYEANLENNPPYFVMEHFEKGCLSEDLVKTWSLEDKLRFYIFLVRAVAHANSNGVIHRDLKPDNILVTDDNLPRVTDFGICYLDDDGTRQTLVDEAVGSFRFMAPEMEDGRSDKIGQHTDIYSLGKIGYWLFSGRIYNRERHRDLQFDLTKEGSDSWRYYFNDYLDKVTHPEPDARPQETEGLVLEFEHVRRAIEEKIRYLDLTIDQSCAFCGLGTYRVAVDALDLNRASLVRNFGFVPVGSSQWLAMVCDRCGNVQSFRKDLCQAWAWKGC
jgi:serine/threonine protein kinase